jgi:acyl carrier protein phosphodiesterase
MGNFLADMLRLGEIRKLPAEYEKGIQLHRLIDTFTDNNTEVKSVNHKLYPYVGKYAPVASDVLFDYFLAKNWDKFYPHSLADFTEKIYEIIRKHIHIAPPHTQILINKMIDDNFLFKYTNLEGLHFVFDKMNKRARFSVDFNNALSLLEKEEEFIDTHFKIFYNDLLSEVKVFCLS